MQNFIEIGGTVAENSCLSFFQDGRCPQFWICGANFGTIHNENLVVFITVLNLVGIAFVVFEIQKIEYLVHLA